jgi:hypothetical protein
MPRLSQNDREQTVGMVQAEMTHQAVADHFKGCVARCEASNNGVHEPMLFSRSYGVD